MIRRQNGHVLLLSIMAFGFFVAARAAVRQTSSVTSVRRQLTHQVYRGKAPWPRVVYDGHGPCSLCAQALKLAQAQFDSNKVYLYGPPIIPKGFTSTLIIGPKPGYISGGNGMWHDPKVFRVVGVTTFVYWQKVPSEGRRLIAIDAPMNWQGDNYTILFGPANVAAEQYLKDPQSHKATTILPYGWRPPFVFRNNKTGHLWAVDVGPPWAALSNWWVHKLNPARPGTPAAHSDIASFCVVEFRPTLATLFPPPVLKLSRWLYRALGPDRNEGTLNPTATLRNSARAAWANVLMRPWALTEAPYNTRATVNADLDAWAKTKLRHRIIYDELEWDYPIAERALAHYYTARFHWPLKRAKKIAARALNVAFRSYFVFSTEQGD